MSNPDFLPQMNQKLERTNHRLGSRPSLFPSFEPGTEMMGRSWTRHKHCSRVILNRGRRIIDRCLLTSAEMLDTFKFEAYQLSRRV